MTFTSDGNLTSFRQWRITFWPPDFGLLFLRPGGDFLRNAENGDYLYDLFYLRYYGCTGGKHKRSGVRAYAHVCISYGGLCPQGDLGIYNFCLGQDASHFIYILSRYMDDYGNCSCGMLYSCIQKPEEESIDNSRWRIKNFDVKQWMPDFDG